jgi:hypothetical protein
MSVSRLSNLKHGCRALSTSTGPIAIWICCPPGVISNLRIRYGVSDCDQDRKICEIMIDRASFDEQETGADKMKSEHSTKKIGTHQASFPSILFGTVTDVKPMVVP